MIPCTEKSAIVKPIFSERSQKDGNITLEGAYKIVFWDARKVLYIHLLGSYIGVQTQMQSSCTINA